jgi:hypothetical protein
MDSRTAEIIRERGKALAWLRAGWGQWYYLGWQGGQFSLSLDSRAQG